MADNNVAQEILTVEAVNQYGFRAAGKNYSISQRLSESGTTPQNFVVGSQIAAMVWTGPKGGKKVNSFQVIAMPGGVPAAAPAPVYQQPATVYQQPAAAAPAMPPMPPALPVTTVATTPAPGGVAPVQKTATASNGNGNGHAAAEDKMSKADWAVRNSEIAIQAIVKSSLESPALGEHVTGKSTPEFMQLTRDYVKFNLETYRMAVQGLL
jgi:hypothetical protein